MIFCYTAGAIYLFVYQGICFLFNEDFPCFGLQQYPERERKKEREKIPVESRDKATIKCSNKKIKSNITNTVEGGETLLRLIEA